MPWIIPAAGIGSRGRQRIFGCGIDRLRKGSDFAQGRMVNSVTQNHPCQARFQNFEKGLLSAIKRTGGTLLNLMTAYYGNQWDRGNPTQLSDRLIRQSGGQGGSTNKTSINHARVKINKLLRATKIRLETKKQNEIINMQCLYVVFVDVPNKIKPSPVI